MVGWYAFSRHQVLAASEESRHVALRPMPLDASLNWTPWRLSPLISETGQADGASNNNTSHGSDLETRMMAVFSMLYCRRAMVQEKPDYDRSVSLDDVSFALESQHDDVTAGTPKKECHLLDQRAVGDAVIEHESV
ncbi:hypothetical protein MAJ_07592, partial [Metarhizium majus ARSEF 297]